MNTDPDTVDISILNVAITEGVINRREKGKALPPHLHAYDSFNVGG